MLGEPPPGTAYPFFVTSWQEKELGTPPEGLGGRPLRVIELGGGGGGPVWLKRGVEPNALALAFSLIKRPCSS